MGRTLKRVPLGFDWPLNSVWDGYLNPYYKLASKCRACGGTGYSPRAKLFSDQWYGYAPFTPIEYGATPLTADHPGVQAFARRNVERAPDYYGHDVEAAVAREAKRLYAMWAGQWSHHLIQADVDSLVAANRLWDFTRVPRTDQQRADLAEQREKGGGFWLSYHNGYTPSADEVNAWSLQGLGHDASNAWTCIRARCEREGVSVECAECKGEAEVWPSAAAKQLCEDWRPTEPPVGNGYQLWETTSEGSPVSPVFESLEALCAWCEGNATTFGSSKTTAAEWRSMLEADFVCHKQNGMIFF